MGIRSFRPRRVLAAGLVLLTLFPALASADPRAEAKSSIDRGLKWLRGQQQENGSWSDYPGITALVLTAYFRSPREYTLEDGPFLQKGMDYLLSHRQEDGSITRGDLPVYNTAVALMALEASGDPEMAPVIEAGRAYLSGAQSDEGEGYGPDHKFYGGIGYGSDERPDLSNLQLALEALAETSDDRDDPAWDKALVFLQRCQNYSETNDQAWAQDDGGFVYLPDPDHSSLGSRSYGSMTYAGLKSFLYAGVDRDDPRVQAALEWSRQHYTLEENPGMGNQGLYYYFHTFAKAMDVMGDATFVDAEGVEHDWYAELVARLGDLQQDDGSWSNSNDRWWERDPVLVTAYAILALEAGYASGR